MKILKATDKDIPELLNLQLLAFLPLSEEHNRRKAANVHETLAEARESFPRYHTLKMVTPEGYIIGSVRGHIEDESLYIGRLMVLPEYQRQGLGTQLLHAICEAFPNRYRCSET